MRSAAVTPTVTPLCSIAFMLLAGAFALGSLLVPGSCGIARAQQDEPATISISGEAFWVERIALPKDAKARFELRRLSPEGSPEQVLSWLERTGPGNPPLPFSLAVEPDWMSSSRSYEIYVEVRADGELIFSGSQPYRWPPSAPVSLRLRMQGSEPSGSVAIQDDPAEQVLSDPPPPLSESLPISYSAVLPCNDCAGQSIRLNLFPGGWYLMSRRHDNGASAENYLGRWALEDSDALLVLHGPGENPALSRITAGGSLRLLDTEGSEIYSESDAELRPQQSFEWFSAELLVGGMFSYLADSANFTECFSGQRWPVAMQGDYLALEQAYADLPHAPGEAVFAVLRAELTLLPALDGPGFEPVLVPHRFVQLLPGGDCESWSSVLAAGLEHGEDEPMNDDDSAEDGPKITQPGPPEDDADDSALEDTYWRLVEVGGQMVPAGNGLKPPYMQLSSIERSVGGNSGCNSFGGNYQLEGSELSFSQLFSTMMYCEGRMEIERAFLDALESTTSWATGAQTLELLSSDGIILARFVAGE